MRRGVIVLLALALVGCGMRGLTEEDLFGPITPVGDAATPGPPSDAAGPDADAMDAAAPRDVAREATTPASGPGFLSGGVYDACRPTLALDARVQILGHRTCSTANKASYSFAGIPVGRHELTAYKKGYEPYAATVEVAASGSTHVVRLMPIGGCAAPPPDTEPCTCEPPLTGCRPS